MLKFLKANKIHILSFILPILLLLIAFYYLKVFPFGTKTILTIDLNAQYSDFFLFYKRILAGDASLFYSFSSGLGGSTLDLFSYYLSSPFNLILLFFSEANITEAVMLIFLLKIACAGLSFSVFLSKKFKSKDLLIVAFSLCYALMSYNIAYYFNLMWLDGVIWLPIIALGIEKMLKQNKPLLFYISLTIALISNWYIGYMLCVFSALYCLYTLFIDDIENKLIKFEILILYGCLSAGSAAFLLLPSFLSFAGLGGRFSSEYLPKINFTLFDLFSKLVTGAFNIYQITSSEMSSEYLNLPNIFCGSFPILLLVLYFFNKKINLKEKIIDTIFLLTLIVSFLISSFNNIWHIFTSTAWFPYRYSFIFCFLIILLACKSYLKIENLKIKKFVKAVFCILFLLILIEKFNYPYIKSNNIVITSTFIILLSILIIIKSKYKSYLVNTGIICIVFFEMYANTLPTFGGLYKTDRNEYYESMASFSKVIQSTPQKNLNYRIACNIDKIRYNTPLALGFNGISFTSSTFKYSLINFFQKLGYTQISHNMLFYNGSTPISDMFLSLKYILSKEQIYNYPLASSFNEINTFENPYALSLGFMVEESILNELPKEENNNPFEFQNTLMNNMSNDKEKYFYRIDDFSVSLHNLKKVEAATETKELKEDDEYYETINNDTASIEYQIQVPESQEIFAYFPFKEITNCKLFINDNDRGEYFSYYNYGILSLGKYAEKENIKLKLVFDKDKFSISDPIFYYLDKNAFTDIWNKLKESQLEVTYLSDTALNGKVNVIESNKVLFTSIPYDRSWKVYVDGQEVQPIKIFNSFIGIRLSEGSHEISLTYFPKGLITGFIVSLISIILALGITHIIAKKNTK